MLAAMLATNSAPAAAAVPTNTTYSNADVKPSARFKEVEFDDRIKNVPWWKQPTKIFLVCCISLALAISLGVGLGVASTSTVETVVVIASAAPSISLSPSQAPSMSLSPSQSPSQSPSIGPSQTPSQHPTKQFYECFSTRDDLKATVDTYISSGCNKGFNACPDITSKYGWPMNSWCVGKVTDMSNLFYEMSTFNDDISLWEMSVRYKICVGCSRMLPRSMEICLCGMSVRFKI